MKNALLLMLTLSVYQVHAVTIIDAVLGSITDQKVDIIVNAANPQLVMGGGVCGAIYNAAGAAQLQKACNQYPLKKGIRCPVGDARITDSFKLTKIGIIKIVHAVGPDARVIKDPTQQRILLESAYTNSLKLASDGNFETIAFPFISSGIYHVDHQLAAEAAVTAARNFVAQNETSLTEIRFVLLDQKDYSLFEKLLTAGQTVDELA